ncbi:Cro/CI family transcriptional regulator [Hahella aquimaris]|uniref:Cro/CI family transcriptional regulator n=1 Tax=Hahella sp. HNIBRBA332 TaxID=3015983 RepID=UPI00273C07A5|nr:Cro/CI family transcriptional regulator [Hahella sp. HNIBRBA332]WLQ15392.1 Cro/CI family transcriptional regulator [Hahella sp. HNIBRBA332]
MKKAEAVQYFGSQQALANVLKLHKSAISQWGDTIPELRAFQLERLTNGKLKHDPNVAAETTRSV